MQSKNYLIFISSSVLLFSSCTPPGSNVSVNGNDVTIKDASGNTTLKTNIAGNTAYPANAPVAQYPGAVVSLSQSTANAGAGSAKQTIMLTSKDPIDKIEEFYQNELKKGNWVSDHNIESNNMIYLNAKRGDTSIGISIIPNNDAATICISLM